MAEKQSNGIKFETEWFKDASRPFMDVASMLIHLDDKGLIPEEMRQALRKHAENGLTTLPMSIATTATALASAVSGDCGLGEWETANAMYGIAAMAEQIHAWNELAFCFGPENTLRGVSHG
ncbi:MAG: hypothetical protein H6930_06135 [Rhodoferax sp.]|nr:hypothetical protein [Rhodoferax sp.]